MDNAKVWGYTHARTHTHARARARSKKEVHNRFIGYSSLRFLRVKKFGLQAKRTNSATPYSETAEGKIR
jgi:hypothetical protein